MRSKGHVGSNPTFSADTKLEDWQSLVYCTALEMRQTSQSRGFKSYIFRHIKGIVMKLILEIKGAEGGTDAKMFANDMTTAYLNLISRLN
jgi:protein subunit release factor A